MFCYNVKSSEQIVLVKELSMADFYIRTTNEVEPLLKRLAEDDLRSISKEVEWLIRSEYERRYGREEMDVIEVQNQDTAES